MGIEQKRGILFSAAPIDPQEQVGYVPAQGDYVVCADGGIALAKRLKIRPDLIVGDFDSGEDPACCPEPLFEGVPVLRVPSEKDDTDTKLALSQLHQKGCALVLVFGGLGGRLDHTLANIADLIYFCRRGMRVVLVSAQNTLFVLENESLSLPQVQNRYLSLFSLTPCCKGVTLERVKYPLQNDTLTQEVPLGISNEFTSLGPASIQVKEGILLVCLSRDGTARSLL